MASTVRFTPLLGVNEESPLCSLLEIDDFTFLVDCGWDEKFTEELLEPVKKVLPRVNAVLLSHPSPAHLGALAYLVGRCGLACPVFSTKPVRRMGEMNMFEAVVAQQAISEFSTLTLDHVDAAFRLNPHWVELRYSQRHVVVPPGDGSGAGAGADGGGAAAALGGGIAITPLTAGRYPGGAVWRVRLLGSGEEVVYAVDYNHRKERLLNETAFHELLAASGQQPALLVSDAVNGLAPALDRRRRDEELLAAITSTVEGDGHVLIPVDPAGRILELALLLDEHFAGARVGATPVLLTATIKTVLEFARSQLEYFGSDMAQTFALKRVVPFTFRKLALATRLEELSAIPGPKVVLATQQSLDAGPARQLLVEWAGQARNTIIFVERANQGTLAATLQHHVPGPEPLRLRLRVARRVPLEGEELEAWQQQQAEEAGVALVGEVEAEGGAAAGAPATPAARLARAPSAALTPAASLLLPSRPSDLPLRSSSGSISRLVRDQTTGAIVQQLGAPPTPGPGGARGAGHGPSRLQLAGSAGAGGGGGGFGADARRQGWSGELLMDGFEPPQDASYPMFPDEDAVLEVEWDEYGAVLGREEFRVPMLLEGGGARAADGMDVDGGAGADGGRRDGGGGDDEEVADEVAEAPTKLVEEEVELELRAALRFFDFEGRPDGRAIRDYLSRAAPRRVALLRGSEAARAELAGALRHDLAEFGTEVHTPGTGDAVAVTIAPTTMAVLGPALVAAAGGGGPAGGAAGLTLRAAGQYGVAWLEGLFHSAAAAVPGAPALMQIDPLRDEDVEGGLTVGAGVGSVLLAQAGSALTLSKLKAALAAAGFESHFPSRGVLAVMVGPGAGGGTLLVTLGGSGGQAGETRGSERAQVNLEGPTCDAYYKVRDVIYTQFGVC